MKRSLQFVCSSYVAPFLFSLSIDRPIQSYARLMAHNSCPRGPIPATSPRPYTWQEYTRQPLITFDEHNTAHPKHKYQARMNLYILLPWSMASLLTYYYL